MWEHKNPKVVFYTYHPDHGESCGYFDPDTPDTIYLNSRTTINQREHTFWHEKKHQQCYKEGCFCWERYTDFWCEYHAFMYEFKKVLEYRSPQLKEVYLKSLLLGTHRYVEYPNKYPTHLKVAIRLFKTKAFKYLASEFGYLADFKKLIRRYDESK